MSKGLNKIYVYPIQQSTMKYTCETCCFTTQLKCHYVIHCSKKKHLDILQNRDAYKYVCAHCKKLYKCHSGLWNHNKKCKPPPVITINPEEFLEHIAGEFGGLRTFITDNIKPTTVNNNLNMVNNCIIAVLNEKCPNAMNIQDFMTNHLKLRESDFLDMIQNKPMDQIHETIFERSFKGIPINRRPIHFIKDGDKQTMHVRDNGVWKPENKEEILQNLLNEKDKTLKRALAMNEIFKYQLVEKRVSYNSIDEVNQFESNELIKYDQNEELDREEGLYDDDNELESTQICELISALTKIELDFIKKVFAFDTQRRTMLQRILRNSELYYKHKESMVAILQKILTLELDDVQNFDVETAVIEATHGVLADGELSIGKSLGGTAT